MWRKFMSSIKELMPPGITEKLENRIKNEEGKRIIKTYSEEIMAALEVRVEKTETAKMLESSGLYNFDLIQKHPWDAGYDVRACIERPFFLKPFTRALVPTGLKIELMSSMYEIQARPRSGLAAKNGIMVVNTPGTIDAGYRDEIMIILYNSDNLNDFQINPGDRIAQLCFRPLPSVQIDYVDKISRENDRGGGFGSSGTK
jgi:dUTP pyrophosphatase